MQETKLADADAPADDFRERGYELAHHGEGRWNGVAIASRVGIARRRSRTSASRCAPGRRPDVGDDEPLAEARMISAVCGGVRVVSVYAPNGRTVDSPFYQAKLAWFERLARWLARRASPERAARARRRLQRRARRRRRLGPERLPRRHPRLAARSATHSRGSALGAGRRLSPAPPRARALHLVGLPRRQLPQELRHAHRPPARHARRSPSASVWAEIDREARKGKPIPSDHAPLVIDLDEPGRRFDAGWSGAEARIAARRS